MVFDKLIFISSRQNPLSHVSCLNTYMNLEATEKYILNRLENELPKNLFYHGLHHTIDVANASLQIADREGITSKKDLKILKTAALFHDAGFIYTYQNHEEAGCKIAVEILPHFGYSTTAIATICELIRATKLPQSPKSELAKILCDADLDYLGRNDYSPIAETLFQELNANGFALDAQTWKAKQIEFLENHRYWTLSEIALRESDKQKRAKVLINQ